jgi:hypothetical protein
MKNEKKYVPNDVFRFGVSLKSDIELDDVTVYTKPFPQPWDKDYDESKEMSLEEQTNLVQEKYFTKERITELKQKLIEKINSEENPFDISCVDTDGNYYVTEKELFVF